MATSESWKDKAGAWQSVTEWHTITAWGDLGERVGGSIKKGDLVYVEGKIKSNKYTGKDGVEKTQYGITANMVKDFTPKEKKEGGSQGTQQQPDNFGDNDFIPEVEDDDVPL
jgi:single-strand DNA-binding protein